MRNKHLLRYSLASLTLVGASLGVFLVACGDDDDTVTPPPSGNDAGGTLPEASSQQDSGQQQSDAAPKPDPARIQFVNAATDFGPNNTSGGLRICFALRQSDDGPFTITPLPALPEQSPDPAIPPAAYIGTGGAVQGAGVDISGFDIQPFIMNAGRLFARGVVKPGPGTPSTSCADLLSETFDGGVMSGNGPLVENVDYWKLPVIPKGTFQPEKSYILVLTGCPQDSAVPAAKCGEGANADGGAGIGNLKVHIIEVDRATAIDADKIGAQFIHASPAGKVFLDGLAVGVLPAFVRANDGGATNVATAQVPLYGKTDLVQVANITPATDSFSANAAVPTLAIPLTIVQASTYPGGAPPEGTIRNGAAFTFIAVGDPTEPVDAGGRPNPKTFHYLAFPNNPPVSAYKP
jgi:hypothetical protein